MAYNNSKRKTFQLLGLFCLLTLVNKSDAIEYKVGGSKGWCVPSDPNAAEHNQWAERKRFQIGDSLVFDYSARQDSVLLVNNNDYANCKTDSPMHKYTDGHTVFKLDHSGPYYFISGNKDNCKKNEKLVVIVLANRTNTHSPPPSISMELSPSPAPVAVEPPSSPPAPGSVEMNPAPAPVSEPPPPPNGASAISIGFVGAFAVSSLLIAF